MCQTARMVCPSLTPTRSMNEISTVFRWCPRGLRCRLCRALRPRARPRLHRTKADSRRCHPPQPGDHNAHVIDTAEAFGDGVSRYRRELLVHCYRMLGTIDEAEDAVQEALARAWQGRDTFRRAISLRAWLYRIATNVCLNAIESRKRDRGAVGPAPDPLVLAIAPPETGPEA